MHSTASHQMCIHSMLYAYTHAAYTHPSCMPAHFHPILYSYNYLFHKHPFMLACTILNHHACTYPPHPPCKNLCHQASIHSSIPLHMCTHPVHHACMHQSKSLCMHAPILHVCNYLSCPYHQACMHACTCPNHHRCACTHPSHLACIHPPITSHMHAPIHQIAHACMHSSSAYLNSCCSKH